MASPTWYFDGDKRRIYEVPTGASYILDMSGYRIYDGGISSALTFTDVKKDLWSRWCDWQQQHDWAELAFSVSGGSLRPTGEYSSADFSLRTSAGWRIVLANFPHELVFNGNLFAEGADSLFDNTRLSVSGVVPRLQGSANLLTYSYNVSGDAGTDLTPEEVALATVQMLTGRIIEAGMTADELMKLMASALLGKVSGAGTGTESFRSIDDSKTRIIATVDENGNRTEVLMDAS